jgi:MFS family permease
MSTPRDTAGLEPPDTHGPARAWAAVAVLALVGTLNYVDRFLPGVLAEPIKRDLALSDTAIGVINGFGFLIVYAVLGIVIARAADRGLFGATISGCLTLWGSMTMLGGAVQSGVQLALNRVGVAVGEAGNTPAAHADVARNFVPEKRSAPLAVITMSIPLASAASLLTTRDPRWLLWIVVISMRCSASSEHRAAVAAITRRPGIASMSKRLYDA